MKRNNPILSTTKSQPSPSTVRVTNAGLTLAIVLGLIGVIGGIVMDNLNIPGLWMALYMTFFGLAALYMLFSLQVAQQWEKAVMLRLGKIHRLAGPGLFWIVPIVDTVANWIDHRVMVTPFSAEKTLTKVAR